MPNRATRILVMFATATLLSGCAHPSTEALPTEAVARDGAKWAYFEITHDGPSLVRRDGNTSQLVLSCANMSILIHTRAFVPEQRWPQPELSLQVGSASVLAVPDASGTRESPSLGIETRVRDSLLDGFGSDTPILLAFTGHQVTTVGPPASLSEQWVSACREPLPPGLRAG